MLVNVTEPDPDLPELPGGRAHGTLAGYQTHNKYGIKPIDDACRAALNAYQQDYRRRRGVKKDIWYTRTYQLALRELGRKHSAELKRITARIRSEQPFKEEPLAKPVDRAESVLRPAGPPEQPAGEKDQPADDEDGPQPDPPVVEHG